MPGNSAEQEGLQKQLMNSRDPEQVKQLLTQVASEDFVSSVPIFPKLSRKKKLMK